ncbi:MAG: DM13 domain-containing protein [Gemmatimonadaceae bacterium]
MQKKNILIALGAIVVIGGWYAFRPERLFIDQKVDEPLAPTVQQAGGAMADANVAVAGGTFHGVHHETTGTATLYRRADGTRVLRFTNFATSNGPDVRIYLVAAPDAQDNATVTTAGFIELGAMKGNQGDQNYEVPESVDLAKYRAVTIWCRRFSVNFATAPLTASPAT